MTTASLILQEQHLNQLQELLMMDTNIERRAYILCGEAYINSDPWDRQAHCKFISHQVIPIAKSDVASSSLSNTSGIRNSYLQVLKIARDEGLTVAIFQCRSISRKFFSDSDDDIEINLIEFAQDKNGLDTKLLSVILTADGQLFGRLWNNRQVSIPLNKILVIGRSICLHYQEQGQGVPKEVFHRQSLAFGEALNQDISMLRVGVVGCGGTGSATATLLAMHGVGQIALFDADIIETTNLNRLHGRVRQADADSMRAKVEVIANSITEKGLGIRVITHQTWVDNPKCRDALKACDVIFGCTDDNAGRIFLNRFAYFYSTPVIDMGLLIEVSQNSPPEIQILDGRYTVIAPAHTCLFCRNIVDSAAASEETLKRNNLHEYEQQKLEAYVVGEGNPNPAVATFTTGVALMAIEEFLHRFQGFRGKNCSIDQRVRKFKFVTDLKQEESPEPHCPLCASPKLWGKGDVEPFLNLVG